MGILQDMGKGAHSQVGALALMGLGMLTAAGCSSQLDGTGLATDSREAVSVVDDDLQSLTTPSAFATKRPVSLEEKGLTRIALNTDSSYAVELPPGTFVELSGAVLQEDDGLFDPTYYRTDDSFVFKVSDNNLGRYEVWIEESDFCNRGWSISDGIYLQVVDKEDSRHVVSAVKLPVGRLDENASGTYEGMLYLQTPDGAIHSVPEPIQKWRNDAHYVPAHINWINSQINQVVSADSLTGS